MTDSTVRGEREIFSFTIELKDPYLRQVYDQNPETVKKMFEAGILDIVGYLKLPSNLQRIVSRIDLDHSERRLALIEGYIRNGGKE